MRDASRTTRLVLQRLRHLGTGNGQVAPAPQHRSVHIRPRFPMTPPGPRIRPGLVILIAVVVVVALGAVGHLAGAVLDEEPELILAILAHL
ncbi:MAG: hypothetical protein K0S92_597 [Desertimonas sp.]|nr:hypothetical protein [Desertimonas sp.]